MNKSLISLLLLFNALMLILLNACQSAAFEVAQDTSGSGGPASSGTTEIESTPTLEPLPSRTAATIASETATSTPINEPTTAPAEEPSMTVTAAPTATLAPSPEPGILRTYEIVAGESEVRFFIGEELFGNPKTVVGRTNQVAGEISLDLQDTQTAAVGTIQVNARELATDDSFRNRALRRQILDSAQDEYQFITFAPSEIAGLSAEAAAVGEAHTFNLIGDLQIRDVVQTVTFEMMVTAVSDNELAGMGESIILRSDYDLQIPSVPGVANVSDEVKLEIEFVAEAADE